MITRHRQGIDNSAQVGNLHTRTPARLSEAAARRVLRAHQPMAVTLTKTGIVQVVHPADADHRQMVGTYTGEGFTHPRWLRLSERIRDDVEHAWRLQRQGRAA